MKLLLNFKIYTFHFEFKSKRPFLLGIIFLFACAPSAKITRPSFAPASVSELRQQIESILQDSSLYQTRTGIKVISLQTNEILYSKDSHHLFHPASNMKLLTTAAALSKLGSNFTFKTIVYADSLSQTDSTVLGNIYLKGFADPELTTRDLWGMVQQLKELGVKKISGDLICDESYLDDLYFGSGWMWDDVSSWYWPPIGALTVNRNCVRVKVKPGLKLGDTLLVHLEPATAYMKIENHGVTVDSSDTTSLDDFKVERKWRENENTVVIAGGLTQQSKQREYSREVVQPAIYVGTLFSEILTAENINFTGNIIKGETPDSVLTLIQHNSPLLPAVVTYTNKVSDNLFAEIILKTTGAEIKGTPGTAEKGHMVIHGLFNDFGVDTTMFELADGSGVSRYNVISPDQIIELLKAMHQDFRVQAEFKTSLPIAGVDGTLKNRMKNTPAEGKLRAKTGSLSGVSALSGYTTTASGELLAFSMMMEHFVVPTSKIRAVQDRIGAVISGFRGSCRHQ